MKERLDILAAVACVQQWEGEECEQEEILEAWQYLVDTGVVWRLEGWFGRCAERLIEEGLIDGGRNQGSGML